MCGTRHPGEIHDKEALWHHLVHHMIGGHVRRRSCNFDEFSGTSHQVLNVSMINDCYAIWLRSLGNAPPFPAPMSTPPKPQHLRCIRQSSPLALSLQSRVRRKGRRYILVVSATCCEIKYPFSAEARRSSSPPTAASFIYQSNAAYAIPAPPHLDLMARMCSSFLL